MKQLLNNKYIYIIIITILAIVFLFGHTINYLSKNFSESDMMLELKGKLIKYGDNHTEEKELNQEEVSEEKSIVKEEDKKITIGDKQIDPNNYNNLTEFITYLNTGSGIILDVDLENEDFYVNKTLEDGTKKYIKFDKNLISKLDDNNDKNYRNKAIEDIFYGYLENKIYGEANNNRSGVRFLEHHELPTNSRLHNDILSPYSGKTFNSIFEELKNKEFQTNTDKQQLAYMYDFLGEYKTSNVFKKQAGLKELDYKISGVVKDTYGKTIKGVKVSLLNNTSVFTVTDINGEYELSFKTYPLTRLRFRANNIGVYSDSYNSAYVIYDTKNQEKKDINFFMQEQNSSFVIKQSDFEGGKTKTIESTLGNKFEFREGVVLTNNNKVYNGDYKVKIFEFNENTSSMDGFLNNDNFDNVYGYAGNLMKTTGMTYLLITDLEGNELYISKKNPITTIQNTNLDIMMQDYYNIGENLTIEQIDLIYEESQKGGYPIDRKFLFERNIGGYSPWWVFNVKKGIWENAGFKFLNKTGLKESLYYNAP